MKLSVCFTVYNQSHMLKQRLDALKDVNDDRIEIVISDDNSPEDIKSLVDSYDNPCFKYCRTSENSGHDLNILHAIECASSQYVMVLRTRDNIVIDNIDEILEVIDNNPDVGYYYFSASLDGQPRLSFGDRIYKSGEESLDAHYYLPQHPSGNVYNKKYLDVALYKKYINLYFDNIYGFSVHEIIRCDLSQKSDLLTSSVIGWEYADTLKASDVAVNSSKNGINVYAPDLCYPRFICNFAFVRDEVIKYKIEYLKRVTGEYYSFIMGKAITISKDKRYYSHYSSKKLSYKRRDVAKKLDVILTDLMISMNEDDQLLIKQYANEVKRHYLYIYPIKEVLRNILLSTPVYSWYRNKQSRKTI